MNRTHILKVALFLLAAQATACGKADHAASGVTSTPAAGLRPERTCGIVSATATRGLALELLGQLSQDTLRLAPADGATINTLTQAARDLRVVCFDDKPHDGELEVVSVARMEVTELSQRCGAIVKPESDSAEDNGRFLMGLMGGRTWIEISAEDGATFNTLNDLAGTETEACIVSDFNSDPGFPVSVRSVAFISKPKS